MIIALLVGSFVFLDKTTRKTIYYDIRMNDRLIGTMKIERFVTEDRIIYKAFSSYPFDPVYVEAKAKLVLNKKYRLESYFEERYTRDGITAITAIESSDKGISFLSRLQSLFVFIDSMPARKDVFIFKEDDPLTYLPILENYDFRKGRSQGFYGLTDFSPYLPPVKRYVTLTSVRDEYLKIDGRKIKTENLILKIKNYPQGSVWVAKSDRRLIMIDLPKSNIRITRAFRPRHLTAKDIPIPTGSYQSRDIIFANKKIDLSGTLTIPFGEGKHPALIFVPSSTPYDRNYAGLFISMADYFSKNGYCTLRYDRRGIGKSSGDATWPLTIDGAEDLKSAIRFLATQPEVDPARIAIVAHGDGALTAIKTLASINGIFPVVFLAPIIHTIADYDAQRDIFAAAAERNKWDESYRSAILQASRDTKNRIESSKFNWAYILRRRAFTAEMKGRMSSSILSDMKKISPNALTVQGKDDSTIIGEAAGEIGGDLIYYSYLDHFFGPTILDGIHPIYYEPSSDMMDAVKQWLDKRLAKTKEVVK